MDEEIDTFCGGMELPDLYTSTTISVRVELHIENNERGIGFLLVYLKIGISFTTYVSYNSFSSPLMF